MYYLSACNRGLFESYYCYVLFLPFKKSLRHYEKYFQFHLYIFLKKNFLVNNYKKQMCYKEKISLLLKAWKMAVFFLHFQYITDSFLVEKWETLERARRYVWKSLSNLDCLDGICFAFFKLFKNGELFGESFSFPIFCKMSSKKLQIFTSNFF